MRLVTCDPHLLFGDALALVMTARGHKMAARAASPEAALGVVADLWITELFGPDGRSAVAQLRAGLPAGAPIVVFTRHNDRSALLSAVAAGANGVALKSDTADELDRVLRRVRAARVRTADTGDAVWSTGARALVHKAGPARAQVAAGSGLPTLTTKEAEVMRRLSLGQSTRAIADGMGVGVATVRTHLQHLYRKFQVHSRLELVAVGARLTSFPPLRAVEAS